MKNKDEKKAKRPYCPACSLLDEILEELDEDNDIKDENKDNLESSEIENEIHKKNTNK